MDELELLKKDWDKDYNKYPKLTYGEIYNMILKKSSSIVKWIFIISLIELTVGLSLSIINPHINSQIIFPKWLDIFSYISIPIIIYFIIQFYNNYKNIVSTDSVKELIRNILKTRKIVRNYIVFNLVFAGIIFSIGIFIGYTHSSVGLAEFNETAGFGKYLFLILIILIITGIFLGFIYGIYYLLYGILLKRLNKNYKELKKLEV